MPRSIIAKLYDMKLLITGLLSFLSITSFSQIYKAKYNVTSSIGDEKAPVPTEMHIAYMVRCDDRYIEIVGKLEDMSVAYSIETGSKSHVIIDTKAKLIYYVEENIMKRLEEYKLSPRKTINSQDFEQHVVNEPQAIIITSKSVPRNILPGILFSEWEYGVKEISSPQLSITLDGNVEKTKGTLKSYASLFKGYEGQKLGVAYFFN